MKLAVALVLALACAAPARAARQASVTVSKCVWRNDVVCDAAPAFIIGRLSTLNQNPAENPLVASVLQVAASEAACHIVETEDACRLAKGCLWDAKAAPSCNVDPLLLAQRDVFRSGCPGSLMESYVRCGAAISKQACQDSGPKCAWFDELEGQAVYHQRRLQGQEAPGGVPTSAPRACMPKSMYALERKRDREGMKRVLTQITMQDPAAWGDCPGVAALRSMAKTCSSFSSPGTCKSIGPLCRWNDWTRQCVTTGAGQTVWALGANATEVNEEAKRCSRAANRDTCMTVDTIAVDPKLFTSVQKGDFSAATNGAGARAAAATAALALAAAAVLLL